MKKLFILGLDCATPQLLFNRYLAYLPTFAGLIRNGTYGFLRSTLPPVTVPAWMAMMTGKDPGQLGFYGFTDRTDFSYKINEIITHTAVHEKTIWEYLGDHGLKSIVLNLPQTYPPRELNGIMVSSFLTPDKMLTYTYPEGIGAEIDAIADGNYIIDVDNFRTNDKKKLLSEIYDMTEKRFKVIRDFVKNKDWDLFVAVEMGIDRLHHGFWSYSFEDHRLYDEDNEFKATIFEFYKYIDNHLKELIAALDDDTELMIVSDHGARTLQGTFCINDWLIENNYLKLKSELGDTRSKFEVANVDWDNTVAWGDGGYYGKIYFNIKGRESNGIVTEDEIEALRKEMVTKLNGLVDPEGNKVIFEIYETNKIYSEPKGCPPDLIILVGALDWRVTNSVGNEKLFLYESTNIDNANHDMNGIFIYTEAPKSALEPETKIEIDWDTIKQYSIIDITPTVLNKFKITIPKGLYGKIIN